MNKDLKEKAEEIFNSVSMLLTETGLVYPVIFMVQKDGMVLPIVSESMEVKKLCSAAVNFASEQDAKALMFICEQSILSIDKDDPRVEAFTSGLIKPSESEDSEDYLTLIYMSATGECHSLIGKIHKDPAGTRYLRDSRWLDKAHTNIFTPWRTDELQHLEGAVRVKDSKGE